MEKTTYSGVMLVTTTPSPGVTEADFNTWYDEIHIPEVQAFVPGVDAVERFRTDNAGLPPRYLAVYRISRPAAAILTDLAAAELTGTPDMLDMVDNPPSITSYNTFS